MRSTARPDGKREAASWLEQEILDETPGSVEILDGGCFQKNQGESHFLLANKQAFRLGSPSLLFI
jgi:hypothetical protein